MQFIQSYKITHILFLIILLIVFSKVYIFIAKKNNIVDNPSVRGSHTIATIRGGGILFYIALLLFFVLFDFQYPYFIIGLSCIAIVSFIDDIVTLSTKIRLPFQFIAIAFILFQLGLFNYNLIIIILIAIVSVAFINMYNFMDGINAITGLYSLSVLGGFLTINYFEKILDSEMILYAIISIIIFGYYNFRKKARMFAGDIGSISLAMFILFLQLKFIIYLSSPVITLLVAVYAIDSGFTILYRLKIGEHIMQPHRHHIYQKLVDVWKWSHLKVSFAYTSLQIFISFLVFFIYKKPFITQIYFTICLLIALSILYVFTFWLTNNKVAKFDTSNK